jgi:hypothetical protein
MGSGLFGFLFEFTAAVIHDNWFTASKTPASRYASELHEPAP